MEEKRHAEISEVAKVADILESMLEDMAFIDSFPVGRWLTRPEYEDKEWVQSWQTLYRENIQKAIDILRDRA